MSTTQNLVQEVRQDFLKRNRDLLALTKNGPDDIMRRLSAALALNNSARENILFYTNPEVLEQKGHAGEVARADFSREMYREICVAFLRVQHNFVIEFVARLTPEAELQLEDIEIAGGERAPRPVVAPPPPPKSAQEQLEDQVVADYNGGLSSDKMRQKMNNSREYRETFNRLSETDRLRSRVTTYTNIDAEFRQ